MITTKNILSWQEALESSQRLAWQATEKQREAEKTEREGSYALSEAATLEESAEIMLEAAKRKAEKLGESEAFEAAAAEWASALENPFKK